MKNYYSLENKVKQLNEYSDIYIEKALDIILDHKFSPSEIRYAIIKMREENLKFENFNAFYLLLN